ncbi:MAG: hypothetical protein GY944_21135 [bacterium]|nr:hypothetical protein [bacterium]MCP5043541.1 hypothetical protein [bacterium]
MNYYTRTQLIERLRVGDDFIVALEEEHILIRDAPEEVHEEFSEIMLERARVAVNLVEELEVNLPGVAVIIRMRESMAEQRRTIESFMQRLLEAAGGGPNPRGRE